MGLFLYIRVMNKFVTFSFETYNNISMKPKTSYYHILLALILLLLSAGIFYTLIFKLNTTRIHQNAILGKITIGDRVLFAEVAKTSEKKMLGLSGRAKLEKNTGMLFIFQQGGYYGFWMKDMNFPIDIIWIDENFHIADLTENISPQTFPQTFHPLQPSKYVLEVEAGYIKNNNVIKGEYVNLEKIQEK